MQVERRERILKSNAEVLVNAGAAA
jgi:hypothetical protein